MEQSLLSILTWREWIWLSGLVSLFLVAIYSVGQFVRILWRD